jgi:hypothetical protein
MEYTWIYLNLVTENTKYTGFHIYGTCSCCHKSALNYYYFLKNIVARFHGNAWAAVVVLG